MKAILGIVLALVLTVPAATADSRWAHGIPEDHGLDAARLEQMRQVIDGFGLPVDSVVIVRHGEIVFEHFPTSYGPTQLHNLYSVTKSVTSLLIGIAIEQGYIEGVDQRVIDFFPNREIANLDERKQRMTLEHLLTMTSGLEWEGPDDMFHSWGAGISSGDPVQYALDRPMAHEPGEIWYYNGACSHLLSAILTEATGLSTLAFAREYLFNPLGIANVRWPRDPRGVYYGGQDIWLAPYDMAKLGQLLLDGGVWNGVQIVPAEWIAASMQSIDLPWYGGYGYQWWSYPESGIVYASGAFEQRIYVIPDHDMVVVFTASNWPSGIAAGERTEGPPMVDWLLGSFILPACAAYTSAEYGGFGFSVEIPRLMNAYAQGWEQDYASAGSGWVSFACAGCPYERIGVQWSTGTAPVDLHSSLVAFLAVLEQTAEWTDRVGTPYETRLGGRPALCQSLELMTPDGPMAAALAAFACGGDDRVFVIYRAIARDIIPWMAPFDGLGTLAESLTCSD